MTEQIFKSFNTKRARPETFFGRVVSYGQSPEGADAVLVNKLDEAGQETGTTCTVVLDPASQIELGEGKERPGIKLYASKGKSYTPPGGTLLIENAVDAGGGVWKARWVSGAVHDPNGGSVMTAEARVGPLRVSEGGKPYRALDVLHGHAAQKVEAADALQAAIRAAITDATAGSAMVRVATADGKQVRGRLIGGRGDTPEARADHAIANEVVQGLSAEIASGALASAIVEVVPVKRYFFGGDSSKSPRLDKLFLSSSEDGSEQRPKGFRPLLITLKHYDDGMPFVTNVAFANGQGFQWYGKVTPVASVAAAPAEGPANEPPGLDEDEDMPPINLAELAAAAEAEQTAGRGPGMG